MSCKTSHIVIVTSEFPPQPGGIGTHAWHLASALSNLGYEVTVITDQRSDDGITEKLFDNSVSFVVKRIKKRSLRVLMYINRIISAFKTLNTADYLIASGKFSLWNVAFCRFFRKRFTMAVVHGTEVNLSSKIFRKLTELSLKRFDKVVAVSKYTKAFLNHLDIHVHIIPNGISLTNWQDSNLSFDDIKLEGTPKLITVGRISARKGQEEVVALLPELLKTFPKLHYHCVGMDTESGSLKQLSQNLRVSSHISFHGVLEQDQLKKCLKQSDIFIMLSKPGMKGDVEGFGIAILEANAMGIPAIGALGSGVEDAINMGKSGSLVSLGDTEGLRQAIINILDNQQLYKQGAKRWAKDHDWNVIVNQYIDLLS